MRSKLLITFCLLAISVNAQCWQKISAGNQFTAAIKSDGTLWTWGDHQYGQLGIGPVTSDVGAPVQVGTANDWSFVCADGTLFLLLKITEHFGLGDKILTGN